MRITKIDALPIYPKLAKRYENRLVDLYGINHRTVFKVPMDNGLVGYGDQRIRTGGQLDPASVEPSRSRSIRFCQQPGSNGRDLCVLRRDGKIAGRSCQQVDGAEGAGSGESSGIDTSGCLGHSVRLQDPL